jgi:hypothetical protein
VATNSSGYIASTTLTTPADSVVFSDELHPDRTSPNKVTAERIERFFFMALPYFLIDNDSN